MKKRFKLVPVLAALAMSAAQAADFSRALPLQVEVINRVEGLFRFEAVHVNTGERRLLADWFNNLILTAGLNRLGTGSIISACQVGTGNTAPAITDTGLQTYLAGTSTQQASDSGMSGAAPYYGYRRITFRFPAGAATGNLTECGIGWATSGANLFSRALIKDSGGTPITVVVAADEYLDVTYELRLYAPASDVVVGPVTISGTDYTFTIRAANVTSVTYWLPPTINPAGINPSVPTSAAIAYNGALGAVTAAPSGTSAIASSVTTQTYSNNSLQRDFVATWDLNTGNLAGGITSLLFATSVGAFQAGVSPAFDKTNTKILTLNFRVSWDRL